MKKLKDKIIAKLKLSRLKWHDLRDVRPVSNMFGFDRGKPLDRYYIESFLQENSSYISGKVLEVAESYYSKKFGTNISNYEVLHVEKNKNATIIGDLAKPETLPHGLIDCFVCTQVFNFIFDFQRAIEGAHQILKPGGVLLATVSGISQISVYDAERWGHYWSFYPQGISKAMEKVFGVENVKVKIYGNSLTAISFLKGIAVEDLTKEEIDYLDENYPVSICIVARKN